MLQLTYSSLAMPRFSQVEIASMLSKSRKENARHGITGILFYSRNRFLQLLEGESTVALKLFKKIRRDPRHHEIRVLEFQFPHRMFANWAMAFHDLTLNGERCIKVDPGVDLHLIDQPTILEMCAFVSERLLEP